MWTEKLLSVVLQYAWVLTICGMYAHTDHTDVSTCMCVRTDKFSIEHTSVGLAHGHPVM